jgi:hypothetical protein
MEGTWGDRDESRGIHFMERRAAWGGLRGGRGRMLWTSEGAGGGGKGRGVGGKGGEELGGGRGRQVKVGEEWETW